MCSSIRENFTSRCGLWFFLFLILPVKNCACHQNFFQILWECLNNYAISFYVSAESHMTFQCCLLYFPGNCGRRYWWSFRFIFFLVFCWINSWWLWVVSCRTFFWQFFFDWVYCCVTTRFCSAYLWSPIASLWVKPVAEMSRHRRSYVPVLLAMKRSSSSANASFGSINLKKLFDSW